MTKHVDAIIIGQGLAGSTLAWNLHWQGRSVLIADAGDENSASRVSAGLMTPVTGRRMVRSQDFELDWQTARAFYQRVEAEVAGTFFRETETVRLRQAEEDTSSARATAEDQSGADRGEWSGELQVGGKTYYGSRRKPSGRLDVAGFLKATAAFFDRRSEYFRGRVDMTTEVELRGDRVSINPLGTTADNIVFCTGFESTKWFPEVPNNPARGDILTISIGGYRRTEVIHRGIWIAPEIDGRQTAGATYDWKDPRPQPKAEGRAELLSRLSELVTGSIEVIRHRAAVRPTMKDYEPVLGRNSQHRNAWIFNGLGSKGAVRAPRLAAQLVEAMYNDSPIEAKSDYARLKKKAELAAQPPLTQIAQQLVAEVVKPGDTVIDATVGNGFDTCHLSRLVGDAGLVIGFDIQEAALASTTQRLQAHGLQNVRLILRGHETLNSEVSPLSVAAVMFNLGYLPRGDKKVITSPETTVPAIQQAAEALRAGGIMTILAYRGHAGGPEEGTAVTKVLARLGAGFNVRRIESRSAGDSSPVLYVVRKVELQHDVAVQ
ncbi:MAG: FAD-dependent oxidoreductase [Planctomycetaceae bacterium]